MWHLEYAAFGGYSSSYCASSDALSALRLVVPRSVSPAQYRLHSQLASLHPWNTIQRSFTNTFRNQLLVSPNLAMRGGRRDANS